MEACDSDDKVRTIKVIAFMGVFVRILVVRASVVRGAVIRSILKRAISFDYVTKYIYKIDQSNR
ncbi:hypothetical protein VS_II1060 [Vibrio atlanticus]|uniref:Uncharacterized protein n=1 Tax=Vibrio atlanticus (strain LGP32) TaxID=575788 RepID=B7VS41_VIBA3|nr:hypothetical protein VS_II1060 [Vibrio atlanticus]